MIILQRHAHRLRQTAGAVPWKGLMIHLKKDSTGKLPCGRSKTGQHVWRMIRFEYCLDTKVAGPVREIFSRSFRRKRIDPNLESNVLIPYGWSFITLDQRTFQVDIQRRSRCRWNRRSTVMTNVLLHISGSHERNYAYTSIRTE